MYKWNRRFGERSVTREDIARENLPRHVAIIMDGNGRWARNRGLPRMAGHHSGMKNVKTIARAAGEIGLEILTLYAFSTENWKRPKDEVDFLMNLPQEFFAQEIDELIHNNVRIRMMGKEDSLPEHTLRPIREAIERTSHNTGLILNLAINYGARMEIVCGVRSLLDDVRAGRVDPSEVDEHLFSRYLLSSELPDPDLLIRTSGELRLSNFMLWQMAYTELWFTDVYWPDFKETHLYEAVVHYQKRKRRYGGL
jgi:undecaprenyl diphosphate synthase